MLTVDGAVPLEADAVNQPLPSPVLVVRVQLKAPDPPLRIEMGCEVAAAALVLKEKLSAPGRLSKNAVLDAATVKVTGTVIVLLELL
jgi:hypothetical protein